MQHHLNTLSGGELTLWQTAHSLVGWLLLLEDSQSDPARLKVDKRACLIPGSRRFRLKLSSALPSYVTVGESLNISEPYLPLFKICPF